MSTSVQRKVSSPQMRQFEQPNKYVMSLANVPPVNDEARISAGREFRTTTRETAKSLAASTVLVVRTTSIRGICRSQVSSPAQSQPSHRRLKDTT